MRVFCNNCRSETNHQIKAQHTSQYPDIRAGRYTGYWEERRQRLLICAGCEEGTLEVGWTCAGDHDRESGEQFWSNTYYPQRKKRQVDAKRFKQLPERLDKIYRETVQGFNIEIRILTAVGLRSLVEGICKDQDIGQSGNNLKTRIEQLDQILPDHIVEDLHEFRFMGNEAVHELGAPSEADLRMAIEICEDLLNYIYELDYKVKQLSSRRNQE
jgi:hypothetical protein